MKKKLVAATLICLGSAAASAGPLRERIMERMAQRQQDRAQEDESGPASSTLPPGVRVIRNVAYGEDARQRFDVYLPPDAQDAPVIFMVHGGAWRAGDKAMGRVVDNKVARWVQRGFVFVSTNYRLVPQAGPLEQAKDVARALAAAQNKAQSWHADPTRFVLMGHSAGAHLVSLLNASPALATQQGARPWLGTVSLDTAAMDIVQVMQARHYGFYDTAFGSDPAYWQATSPMSVLSAEAPPILAVCSTLRPDKPCPGAHAFAAKARRLGAQAEVLEQALNHADINQRLGTSGAYTDGVEDFLASLDPALKRRLRQAL